MKKSLAQGVELYLATQRRFGFELRKHGFELRSFLRYIQQRGHTGALRALWAIEWAQQPQNAERVYWASRLDIVRRFACFWKVYDPRTEIPPRHIFGPSVRRRAVHLYSRQEVCRLLQSTSALGQLHPLRGPTFCTLLGLLDCTGLRIGEALALAEQDIDWGAGILMIRRAKFGRARFIPLHRSTLEKLQAYQSIRDQLFRPASTPSFFVTIRGKPLGYRGVSATFRDLCRSLGWTQEPIPRLHDLRHSFAVRTLLSWYRSGEPVEPKLWTLSTYLGHRHLADTYWYLSAVPELMALSQQRFAAAQHWASGGLAS